MTNGDKIRNMTDEELAMIAMCPNENGLADIPCGRSDSCNCYACILEWLKKEVPEEKPWKKAFMRTFLGRNGGM